MHNLYLGTAKHMISIWKEIGIIGTAELAVIQSRVDEMVVPHNIGRIPNKISSKFSSLTADQWRNWTNVYSLHALRGILPEEHYTCWSIFVEASIILSQHSISMEDVNKADEKLLLFCERFEEIYGKESCTPNMHLHCHLKECILDFGPISSFWVFPFERYNGIMQSFLNNWISPELQMMKKFVSYQNVIAFQENSINIPSELSTLMESNSALGEGSLRQTIIDGYEHRMYTENYTCPLSMVNAMQLKSHTIGIRTFEHYFTDEEVRNISTVYSYLYPSNHLYVQRKHIYFYDLHVHGQHYLSNKARSHRSSVIMAIFPGCHGNINSNPEENVCRFGEIQCFVQHCIDLSNTSRNITDKKTMHLFARVKWYRQHPGEANEPWPLQIVATDFEPEGPSTFIPVSRIMCRCAISHKQTIAFNYGEDCVHIVCPVFSRVYKF